MTIHLSSELERSIRAAVLEGLFVSVDEAMAEAARLLLRELAVNRSLVQLDPLLGCLREDADLMDEVVADVYRQRRDEPCRVV